MTLTKRSTKKSGEKIRFHDEKNKNSNCHDDDDNDDMLTSTNAFFLSRTYIHIDKHHFNAVIIDVKLGKVVSLIMRSY